MSTLSSGFSPKYSNFNTLNGYSEEATAKFDVMAYIQWAISCGIDVVRLLQDLAASLETSCFEALFRPSYRVTTATSTLYATEIHEGIAKDSYIQSIGGALGQEVSDRLAELSKCEAGWDGADAAPMSIESLSTLETFIHKAGRFSDDIGFFLGYDGEILINWRDETGELTDMAFFDGLAELYGDVGEEKFSIDDQCLYERLTIKHHSLNA